MNDQLRGVFTVKPIRKTLFSASVEIHTEDLRRWKPRITIPRTISDEAVPPKKG